MVEDPHEIILEHLRYLRSKADNHDKGMSDLKSLVLSLREEVNGLRGDILRQERALAAVEHDIDRIKVRLDLVE